MARWRANQNGERNASREPEERGDAIEHESGQLMEDARHVDGRDAHVGENEQRPYAVEEHEVDPVGRPAIEECADDYCPTKNISICERLCGGDGRQTSSQNWALRTVGGEAELDDGKHGRHGVDN
jgi:hypothetical protein